MNKTLTIVTALLVLAFIGYFATNQVVSNRASEEIERLAGPKLQELGIQYSDLRVNPAGGSLKLRNVQIDEAYAEELTVKASHKDLLELMGGESMFLHGLEVEVANVRLSDNRGREGLEIGQGKADIDALLDLTKLQRDPDLFFQDLLAQETASVSLEGRDWLIRSDEIEDELKLPMTSFRLSEWSLDVDKNGLLYHVQAMARESQLGQIEAEAKGSENLLTYFRGSLNDISFANEDVQLSLSRGEVEVDAPVPFQALDDMSDEWLGDLIKRGQSFNWSILATNLQLSSPDFIEAARELGLSGGQITISSLQHDASFSEKAFKAGLTLRSNAGDARANVDMRVDNLSQLDDPDAVDFRDLSMELTNLLPMAASQLRSMPSPLEPRGPNGFAFSYRGSAAGLAELGL